MSQTIIGLDPAINSPGVAATVDGILVAAWNVKIPASFKRLPEGERIQAVADRILYEIRSRDYGGGECVGGCYAGDVIVYERPQVYGPGRGKGDPNDLIKVAEVAAAVVHQLGQSLSNGLRDGISIVRVTPQEWTAGTSKNTDSPFDCSRWKRLAMILTPEEQARVPEQHDAIDAVGLALHPTKRGLATPRRVYPGASPPRS